MNFIMRWLRKLYLKQSGLEKISPNDWIKRDKIHYYETEKVLNIKLKPHVSIHGVKDSGSMDGLLDIGHNVILTDNFDKAKLAVGDIIAYPIPNKKLLLHRIVEIKEDKVGRIYRTRGDNCIDVDPYYIFDKNIKYLCVGILY